MKLEGESSRSQLLADWDIDSSSSMRLPRSVRRLGRALVHAVAWYLWAVRVFIFPLGLVTYWILLLVSLAFTGHLPSPPRSRYSARYVSTRTGPQRQSARWLPPELLRTITPPALGSGVLRGLYSRLTRWW